MKKIFYLVNGMGLGNSVRADAVITELKRSGFSVTLFTAGNGLKYFAGDSRVERVLPLGKQSAYSQKRSFLRMINLATQFLWHAVSDSHSFYHQVQTENPDFILSDSVYLAVLPFLRKRWFAINNSDCILRNYRFSSKTVLQFGIELLDFCFHKIFCKNIFSPKIVPGETHKPFRSVGMTVRNFAPQASPPKRDSSSRKVGVIHSGSGLSVALEQTLIGKPYEVHVIGAEGVSTSQMKYHGKTKQLAEILGDADLIVGNAGFLTITDILFLKKPLVLCPIPHHAEQEVNAVLIEGLGVGVSGPAERVASMVDTVYADLRRYNDAYSKHGFDFKGAVQIAKALESQQS